MGFVDNGNFLLKWGGQGNVVWSGLKNFQIFPQCCLSHALALILAKKPPTKSL